MEHNKENAIQEEIEKFLREQGQNIPQKPHISQCTWNEENLERYRCSLNTDARQSPPYACCKFFYIDPKGTLMQNELLVSVVINYIGGNVRESTLLNALLSHGSPIFRTNCMQETAPESGKFIPVSFDLIQEIIKKEDAPLLKKLYPYIDLSEYEPFADQIAALMAQ